MESPNSRNKGLMIKQYSSIITTVSWHQFTSPDIKLIGPEQVIRLQYNVKSILRLILSILTKSNFPSNVSKICLQMFWIFFNLQAKGAEKLLMLTGPVSLLLCQYFYWDSQLSLCVQVVAEDSYLNEVQNSGKWGLMLLSMNQASLHSPPPPLSLFSPV